MVEEEIRSVIYLDEYTITLIYGRFLVLQAQKLGFNSIQRFSLLERNELMLSSKETVR